MVDMQLLLKLLHLRHLLLLARRALSLLVLRCKLGRRSMRRLALVGALHHACNQISSAQKRPYAIPAGPTRLGGQRLVRTLSLLGYAAVALVIRGGGHVGGGRRGFVRGRVGAAEGRGGFVGGAGAGARGVGRLGERLGEVGGAGCACAVGGRGRAAAQARDACGGLRVVEGVDAGLVAEAGEAGCLGGAIGGGDVLGGFRLRERIREVLGVFGFGERVGEIRGREALGGFGLGESVEEVLGLSCVGVAGTEGLSRGLRGIIRVGEALGGFGGGETLRSFSLGECVREVLRVGCVSVAAAEGLLRGYRGGMGRVRGVRCGGGVEGVGRRDGGFLTDGEGGCVGCVRFEHRVVSKRILACTL
ncbi:hypothetical protein BU23DRAFT_282086 [Bimuria novae-zelandiae CBS 107.79]|uniref:Uncharacterized protein n=1 Tax=Bimuria novae-zelandiae CBS 107.79 TaxID=1447943 RepID=A0A6A5UV63_9PLEO|nr:hypothetical protein BU23DRAFT_282086 [Bimuria novae-zelandiae CBS 107.79]